jgi:UDPglucose--hexose-1-phosphate uridylyltransferase
MPELRRDPVIGRWVIIAADRSRRPDEFRKNGPPEGFPKDVPCVFCPGNEHLTPPEIMAIRPEGPWGGAGWRARVVPNKFPALMVEGELSKRGDGLYDIMNGVGAHEVVIETPRHEISLTGLSDDEVRDVLGLYKARMLDLRNDHRLVFAMVFKNVGARAGASQEHTHSQIIVTPIVPLRVQNELERCKEYYEYRDRCLLCDMVVQEISSGARVVLETPNFVAFEPFAARFPFETHLMPKRHLSHFEMTEDGLLPELARGLRATLTRIERAVDYPCYNYLIHTSPLNAKSLDHYHWHFEIIPRITRTAGFEWGTGFYINPVPPEHAAQYLREVKV